MDLLEKANKYRADYSKYASGYYIVGEMMEEIAALREQLAAEKQRADAADEIKKREKSKK